MKRFLSKKHESGFAVHHKKKKHKGFVVSLEVMLAMLIFTQFSTFTMYAMTVMNSERYISTILTSTASQAARWGGNDTKAFKKNIKTGISIQQIAQNQLNQQVPNFNATITVTPESIKGDKSPDNLVKARVTYRYPSPFRAVSKVSTQKGVKDMGVGLTDGSLRVKEIEMPSVMRYGKLL